MGIGEFLTGVDDSIDGFIAKLSPGYRGYLEQEQAAKAAAPQRGESFFQASNADLGAAFAGMSDIPGFTQLMHVLDAPRRGIDTALITAQHADSVGRRRGLDARWGGTDFGEFFNASAWARAWDAANFENADRVTGGQLLTSRFLDGENTYGLDPFDATEAQTVQDAATSTWYGRTLTTAIDLGTSFVSLPGTGVLARGRQAAGVQTIADAERVAQRYNEVGVVGRSTAEKVGDKARQYAVPNGAQNVDALVARQVEGLKELDGLDEFQNFTALKSRLETAPDGEIAKLANVFTEINKIDDVVVRERMRTNTFLAALGSSTAKRVLAEEAPLLAKNFENLTSTPREFGAFTELYAMRLDGDDVPINEIVDSVWNRPGDKAELAALKDLVKQRRTALTEHNRLVAELRELKPKVRDTPEARHIKAKREDLTAEVRKLEAELRTARKDLHGTRRWAAGAARDAKGVGATDDVVDFNQAIGDARRRVQDLEARLAQVRSDRDLLNQTPLHDPQLMDDWRSMVDEAVAERAGIRESLDLANADRIALRDAMKVKKAEIASVSKHLDRSNAVLSDILDVAGKDSTMALVGDAKPTLLNRLKQNIRDDIGGEHYVTAGDGNTIVRVRSLPTRAARMALSPQARGQVALNEVGLGARQLADTMGRSKVFTPDEIAAYRNELIRTPAMDRIGVVERLQEEMVERMALRFYRERFPDISPEEAARQAKEVTGLTSKAWGKGNDWVARAADEQVDDSLVAVRDADGQYVMFDGPSLRSQLADAAPILDPWDFERLLKNHEKTLVGNIRNGLSTVANLHDAFVSIWKVGALLRPGLAVRAMLDTGPRALASMSAAENFTAAVNGAANFMHNRTLRGLAKVHLSGKTPDEVAAQMRYLGLKPVKVGKGKYEFRFADDAADLQTKLSATSKGQTVHGALFHDITEAYDGLMLDRASWKRNKPDSTMWHVGYKAYADMLLASPTARKLAEMMTKAADDVDVSALREQIKASPEFTAEYRKFAQPMGRTKSEFLQQLVHEVDLMFPSERLLKAAQQGGLSKKFLDREIPREARFEIPAPEMSALQAGAKYRAGKEFVDKAFRNLLDKPDMWLARNPVAVQVFNRRVKQEYAALEARFGKGYELSAKEAKLVEERARGAAIGYVRNTFFDTTRYTGLHRSVARFSPFIAAWEDAMISWGRLIYDDPRRLTKLAAAYHSPYTVQTSNDLNLVVNENGERIGRGSDAEQVLVVVPPSVSRAIVKGVKPFANAIGWEVDEKNVGSYRIRLDAINSIAQGETWWLPGVGPSVAVGAAYALGSGNIISREAALDIADTDSALGKALLKSVFLGGEVPPADASSLAQSTLPGWVRTAHTQAFTTGKIRTRQTTFNYLVAEALQNGEQLNEAGYERLWTQADKTANAAAVVRVAMSAGTGMTGTASVDGQFYADQMHIIYAMTDEQRGGLTAEEFFAKEYPEAADLDWSITKNETGIVASVNAAKAEARHESLLKQPANRKFGWMILGRDNVVETNFSRTAYSMQRTDGNRTYLSPDEAQQEAQSAVGWRQYNAWSQEVADTLVAQGADPETVTMLPQYRAARKTIREYLQGTNPAFAEASLGYSNTFDETYLTAQRFATSSPLKDRSDMVAFRDYDAARREVMAQFGIQSFAGTSEKYVQAKAVMMQVGETLAARDLGFQQMWDRFLEREVD